MRVISFNIRSGVARPPREAGRYASGAVTNRPPRTAEAPPLGVAASPAPSTPRRAERVED